MMAADRFQTSAQAVLSWLRCVLAILAIGFIPGARAWAAPPAPPSAPATASGSLCLDVRAYGARLEAASDDTAAFERAVTAVGAQGGGCLVVPGRIRVCDAVIRASNIIIRGTSERVSVFEPVRPNCGLLHLGDAKTSVNGVWLDTIGFDQPRPGVQTAGAFVAFDNAYASGVRNFFARNPFDMFQLSATSGAIYIDHGIVRTVTDSFAIVQGSNDQYFDSLLVDYDGFGRQGEPIGNSRSCFEVAESRGSLVISNSDFGHCGVGVDASPREGRGIEWLFISNSAFDTCTAGYQGTAFRFAPSGAGPGGASFVHGVKISNSWGSGCKHGLVSDPQAPAYVEAMAFDNFTSQGNSEEAVVLRGDSRSFSFVNPQFYRNSASVNDRFANVRIGASVGNVSFIGGKIGGIGGTPRHDTRWGIQFEQGYAASAAIVGTDLCGNGPSGAAVAIGDQPLEARAAGPARVAIVASFCAEQ